jgi:hypothetical protein
MTVIPRLTHLSHAQRPFGVLFHRSAGSIRLTNRASVPPSPQQRSSDVKKTWGCEQKEIRAGRQSAIACEHPKVEEKQASHGDRPTNTFMPPSDDETQHHANRE